MPLKTRKNLVQTPTLFAISPKVSIPFIGDSQKINQPLKTSLKNVLINPQAIKYKKKRADHKKALQFASDQLKFSFDVISERAPETLSYKDLKVGRIKKKVEPIRKKEASQKFVSQSVKSLSNVFKLTKPPKSEKKIKEKNVTENNWIFLDGKYVNMNIKPKKVIETVVDEVNEPKNIDKDSETFQTEWDLAVMKSVSKETAKMILFQNMPKSSDKNKLENLIRELFGCEKIDLYQIENDVFLKNEEDNLPYLNRKKKTADQMKIQQKNDLKNSLRENPILKKTFGEYFKLPKYLNQLKQKNVECEAVNKTAENIQINSVKDKEPLKMKQFFKPSLQKTLYDTSNEFEIKTLSGQSKQVYQKNKNKIILSDQSEFLQQFQNIYPKKRQEFVGDKEKKIENIKGWVRWAEKPRPVDSVKGLIKPSEDNLSVCSLNEIQKQTKVGQIIENKTLVYAVESWRRKWTNRWQDLTLADILIDLDDIHASKRLAAMAVCTAASLYSIRSNVKENLDSFTHIIKSKSASLVWSESIQDIFSSQSNKDRNIGHLPEELILKSLQKLTDTSTRVQLAAAMCLHACNRDNDVTISILEHHLQHGIQCDQLAAAQFLALRGDPKAKVVQQIVHLLLETDEVEQATNLLVHISRYTRLAHSLLAEQLNNSNWKIRCSVCNVLGSMKGGINHDLINKLKRLMWQDWSREVRGAAARALGKTGHGRTIHYELRDKLLRGSDREVVEALRKIAHIGIMTASLLTEFLHCFRSDYISVRIESCSTASQLMMKDLKIIETLTELLQFDVSWKVRAHAVKAISNIALVTDDVINAILWAIHFESEEGLRLEAVLALKSLGCKSDEAVTVLQDRWFVEPSLVVKRAIQECLDHFDVHIYSEMKMMKKIRMEIEKMCDKKITCTKVLLLEDQSSKIKDEFKYLSSSEVCENQSPEDSKLSDTLSSQTESESLKSKSQRSTAFTSASLPTLDEKDESVSSELEKNLLVEEWIKQSNQNENDSFSSNDEDSVESN